MSETSPLCWQAAESVGGRDRADKSARLLNSRLVLGGNALTRLRWLKLRALGSLSGPYKCHLACLVSADLGDHPDSHGHATDRAG